MPLVIVVVALLIIGVIWRARAGRRLTIEQSVDRYRQTLSAVHDAAARSSASDARTGAVPPTVANSPIRTRHTADPGARRRLVIAAMGAASVVVIGIVIAGSGKSKHRAGTTTTIRTSTTRPAPTTTTRPAPTTSAPVVHVSGTSGTTFTVSKPQFTIVVHTKQGVCWVEMRDTSDKVLFAGTVATGQSQSVTATGVTVQLGNPAAVDVKVEDTPVPFTVANGSPVTLHFVGTPA